MGYPKEKMVVWQSESFDIGNTAGNVDVFVAPCRLVVHRALAFSTTAVSNSFTVSADSYDGTTQGSADICSIVVPDSASAFASYYDDAGKGVALDPGDKILVQVDEAGDSGEKGRLVVLMEYEADVANTPGTETA